MEELSKSYNPEGVEEKWYAFWIANRFFVADPKAGAEPYSIVIPPPNITGTLHMGHALNTTLQDVLIRWKRMSGYNVLWVPGTDHAGIATQNVVERDLSREGIDRYQLGRDAFIETVWKWKAEYGDKITHQLKRLGASCDWSRERFTLDDGLSRAVVEVFVSLYEQGLIYRDNRLINWCTRCHTALSDIEVEHETFDGRLTFITYPADSGKESLVVATTRPETMLGDTAVAVHPNDKRYKKRIGTAVRLPLTERTIPVIADDAVDPAFGTGAVKVTPAHDFNDEAIARRQRPPLALLSVIGDDGRMTAEAGPRYAGLDRYECRKKVLKDLERAGLVVKTEHYEHSIGQCYRCKTVIEPLSTPQWYVRVKPLAEKAIAAVREEKIRIFPKTWDTTYYSWMEHIKDWCISRQIWWGHRIPAWYCNESRNEECKKQKGIIVSRLTPTACPYCGSADIEQDEDVLDTWFSSALWPFSTLGWPESTPELKTYYPTTVLVTGFDIIFFWVARMIMMGVKFMKDVPFRDVYIHALVRDMSGQKMSKSKGNVVDPLVIMKKYGTDAFRFTLAAFAAQGRDIKFSEERVEGYRHFINKLWNATRFILLNSGGCSVPEDVNLRRLDVSSRWIVSRLAAAAEEMNASLREYRFNDATHAVYHFVWHELCDWYIEMVKPILYDRSADKQAVQECLLYVLEHTVRLLHPFMPYVTEELWQNLPVPKQAVSQERQNHDTVFRAAPKQSIVLEPFPGNLARDPEAEAEMNVIIETVTGIRSIRGELNLSPSLDLAVHIKTLHGHALAVLEKNSIFIEKLAKANIARMGMRARKPGGSASVVRDNVEVYIPLAGLLDVDLEVERLKKEDAKIEQSLSLVNRKLMNEDFLNKAPKAVVQKEKEKYDAFLKKKEKNLENLKKLYEIGMKK